MYTYEHPIRVRYGETDTMGYVYYGNYALYYEEARTEMLRHLGIPYSHLEEMGVMLPVAEMHVHYVSPARYDDLLIVRVTIPSLPTVKIISLYEIFFGDRLINKGEVCLIFVDATTRRPCRPPHAFLDTLQRYFAEKTS